MEGKERGGRRGRGRRKRGEEEEGDGKQSEVIRTGRNEKQGYMNLENLVTQWSLHAISSLAPPCGGACSSVKQNAS